MKEKSDNINLNVLSLCDGMSCGQMAFEKVGIKVNKYFASEIKETAIKCTIYSKITTQNYIGSLSIQEPNVF